VKVSLIMPIHNEAEYLPESLKSLKQAENQFCEFIFVLDRCNDNSEGIVLEWFPKAKVIRKETCGWNNSIAENYQLGFTASRGNVICTQDADATTPENLEPLFQCLGDDVASVAPKLITCKEASFWNWLYFYWEKTRSFAPFGQEPYGAFRLIRRDCLERVGGFKDVVAQETQLDIDFRRAGYKSVVVEDVIHYHLRKFSFRKAVRSQIRAGRMRRNLDMPFWRVLAHTLVRLRFFVVYGYVLEYFRSETPSEK